jgi:hypothetical protein
MVAVTLGWPAVITSIIVVLAGIARGRSRTVLIGALLGCPFLLYLLASPRIGWLALIVGVLYVGSSQAVARSRRGLAFTMVTPFIALSALVASLVLRQ